MAAIIITSRIKVLVNETDQSFGPVEFDGLVIDASEFGGWATQEELIASFAIEQERAIAALNRTLGVLAQPIEDIMPSWLSARLRRRSSIRSVRDLLDCTEDDLLNIDQIGPSTVKEIRHYMEQHNLKLKGSA